MIFVTVGSDLPFDRLVKAVDGWAGAAGRHDVFAQIGKTSYRPTHIAFENFLEPPEFQRRMSEARVVVAHAGMGTILTALQLEKPILVVPRRLDLREVRNDHQTATCRHLAARGLVRVALDEHELVAALGDLERFPPASRIPPQAEERLITTLRTFITAVRPS